MARVRLKPIARQVVVVMGASSGMGREAALRFARRGAKVVVAARREAALLSLVEEIVAAGGEAAVVVADTSDFEQVRRVAEIAIERFGRLDTWVQVAGVGLWALGEETLPEEWKRVIDVNLTGAAYGALAALPRLRQAGGGALILISSIEAELALPYQAAYAASKHGVHAVAKTLRLELAHEGVPISVTEIMPAGTNTPIFDLARTRIGVKPQPIPPHYEPSVAAEAILFAAEHPTREIVLSAVGKAGIFAQGVAPRLIDTMVTLAGFGQQRTPELKSDTAPTNLFEPVEGWAQPRGTLGKTARSWSLYVWLQTHPRAKQALNGVVLLGVAGLVGRALHRRGQS